MAEYNYTDDFNELYEIVAKHDLVAIAYVAEDEYDPEVNEILNILQQRNDFSTQEIESEIVGVFTRWFGENLVSNISREKIHNLANEISKWNKARKTK